MLQKQAHAKWHGGSSLARSFSEEASSRSLRFDHAFEILGHPDKRNGGEDAAFVSSSANVVAVADGVGGWATHGVDAGAYARSLMRHARRIAEETFENDGVRGVDPLEVLTKAHALAKERGSATVCVAAFTDRKMRAANIGDSGFVVVRGDKVAYKSEPQQHGFNFPFQIGPGSESDSPKRAERFEVDLQRGDTVVLGSDGLFDNIFDRDLCRIVSDTRRSGKTPAEMAKLLALRAQTIGKDPNASCPFSKAAAQVGYRFRGGKLDDTAVIVTYVSDDESESPRSRL